METRGGRFHFADDRIPITHYFQWLLDGGARNIARITLNLGEFDMECGQAAINFAASCHECCTCVEMLVSVDTIIREASPGLFDVSSTTLWHNQTNQTLPSFRPCF